MKQGVDDMSFATAINCMDGRVQLPVINYIMKKLGVQYIDAITEPGPNVILSQNSNKQLVDSILNRLDISLNLHKSKDIYVVGHHDCGGNPSIKSDQFQQTTDAVKFIQEYVSDGISVTGLWVDENWVVHEQ